MKSVLDKNAPKAAYLQLYEQLKRDITARHYEYGHRLPSKRSTAADAGVSVITVEHAYALLCEEGYVEARERSGYFVIYKPADFLAAREMVPEPSVSATALGASGEFPYSLLAKKMRKVLSEQGERLLVKSPNRGCTELRTALSAYLARSIGIEVMPEQIVVGSGAEYLYSMVVQLLGKERIFALEEPGYEMIRRVYEANGVRCEALPLGADGIRSAALAGTNATVLHVTPFNSFPSGVSADASKRREYIDWALGRDGYIVEDNYDSELTVSKKFDDTLFSSSGQSRVLYLNTFSQTIAPSLRVGYMLLPAALLASFEEKLGFYSCPVPVFEQMLLAELLQSGDFERHINRVRRQKRKLRE